MTSPPVVATRSTKPSIRTVPDLHQHLQWAIELEHATLPPYLCALYSLDPQRNPDAAEVLSGIFVEEMLHLALAANLLNAVGGRPRLDSASMLLPFPRPMPHGDPSLRLALMPFGPDALEMVLRIERPAPPLGQAEPDRYQTIGQFYSAIEAGIGRLCDELGEQTVFVGDHGRQVAAEHFQHSAGRLVAVGDRKTALSALAEIVDQGEGTGWGEVWDGEAEVAHPDRGEVAHYYRLLELKVGRRFQVGDTPQTGPTGEPVTVDFDAVMPMRINPRLADHAEDDPIRIAQERFNATYSGLLGLLEESFNGTPTTLGSATGTMYALRSQAQAIMQIPDGPDHVAGPTFDYVAPGDRG